MSCFCQNSFTGQTGIMFPEEQEVAFSVSRFWFGFGSVVTYLYTLLVAVRVQIWLTVAQLVLSTFTYSILILRTMGRDQFLPCLTNRLFVPTMDSNAA